jgi:hypothetical protein
MMKILILKFWDVTIKGPGGDGVGQIKRKPGSTPTLLS